MHTRTWKDFLLTDIAILVWMAVALIILHCLTNNQYGFHRDELNFIEDGRHLAWGYVDCPPFTPFVAHIAEMLFGTSLVGIRFFPAVAQGLVLVLTGLMVRRMGGNRWAQVIAAGGAIISGVSLSQGSIFMYVSFDFLWWVVVAYGVISLLKTGDARWWLAIGAAIGLGMMTKLTMSFLVAGSTLYNYHPASTTKGNADFWPCKTFVIVLSLLLAMAVLAYRFCTNSSTLYETLQRRTRAIKVYAQHSVHPTGGTAASRRARFQALCVAWSWFRQNGAVSSHPPAGNAHR